MLTGSESRQLEAQWNWDDRAIAGFAWLVRTTVLCIAVVALLCIVVVALLWGAVTGERADDGR